MTHVQVRKDVTVFHRDGADWVRARSGGVSTFSTPGFGNLWWELPAGCEDPEDLIVVNDHGGPFSWEPRMDRPLTEFVALLASTEPAFRQVA